MVADSISKLICSVISELDRSWEAIDMNLLFMPFRRSSSSLLCFSMSIRRLFSCSR